MVCINMANLCCHSVYSVLAAFFPQEAKAKGMSEDGVGIVFASFAAVIFVCSPFAGRLMSRHGKVWVYIWGLILVSFSTILFSLATWFSPGMPFASWCLGMRILQGIGSAMEEVTCLSLGPRVNCYASTCCLPCSLSSHEPLQTAAYAIIAELDSENISFFLGICEISTGLGYMVSGTTIHV